VQRVLVKSTARRPAALKEEGGEAEPDGEGNGKLVDCLAHPPPSKKKTRGEKRRARSALSCPKGESLRLLKTAMKVGLEAGQKVADNSRKRPFSARLRRQTTHQGIPRTWGKETDPAVRRPEKAGGNNTKGGVES